MEWLTTRTHIKDREAWLYNTRNLWEKKKNWGDKTAFGIQKKVTESKNKTSSILHSDIS